METGVTIIQAFFNADKNGLVFETKVVDMQKNLTNLELFEIWNKDTKSQEIVLIISSVDSKLHWYHLNKLNLGSEKWFWSLPVSEIVHLQYRIINDKNKLLIITKDHNKSEVLVYEFDGPKLWLSQVIPIASLTLNLAISEFASHTFLLIPQRHLDMVQAYKFKQDHFIPYQNLSCSNVSQVQSFKIGFKSFFTTNGNEPGIYQITKRGILLENHELNLDRVEFWLPVPIKTYRDEVILITQRSLEHGPHKSISIDAFIFNGNTFVQHEEVPCLLYGETEYGFSCMADEENGSGLEGSTILSVEKMFGVLIPSTKHSRLFTFHTTLKDLKSPVEIEIAKLQESREKIEKLIEEHQQKVKLIEKATQNAQDPSETLGALHKPVVTEVILGNSQNKDLDLQMVKDNLEQIDKDIEEIMEKLTGAVLLNASEINIDKLIVNGELEIKGTSSFSSINAETINGELVEDVFNDLFRKNKAGSIKGKKTFTNVKIHDLIVEHINGKNASNIVFTKENSSLIIQGDLIFENAVEVLGDVTFENWKVNDHNLKKEVWQTSKNFSDAFKSILENANTLLEVDVITIHGNLSVTNINGINVDNFINRMCLTNTNNHVPGDIFIADLNVTHELNTKYLNGLKFPEEYVLRNTTSTTVITGKKYFKNDLIIEQLDVEGEINNIDPKSLITLNKDQEFNGTYSFYNLTATNHFEVNGDIKGPSIKEFLENPILTQSNRVKGQVIFTSLEVDGKIIISGSFNNSNFDKLLGDVVYIDEDHAVITSTKTSPHGILITNDIQINSNTINTTPLDQFITTDSDQIINIKSWNGDVEFRNLEVVGTYDGINITELDQQVVKLTGEQFVTSTLQFENEEDHVVDLTATDFIITETLNDLTPAQFLFTTGDNRTLVVDSLAFDSIKAGDLIVDGDIVGPFNNFSIEEFDNRRVSATRDQVFTAEYMVDYLETTNIKVKNINGIPYEALFDIQYYADIVSRLLFDGKLKITNLFVNGSITALSLNGRDLGILQRCLWTNKNNNISTGIFKGNVFVKSISTENFNSVNFNEFSQNIVKKHEKDLTLQSFKTFTNGFHVVKYINSDRLNNILIDDILTKSNFQEMVGPLNIYGDVIIYDTEIHENINDISVDYLTKTFEFNGNTLTINEDMLFNRLAYIKRLWIDGYVQDYNVTEFLTNIVYSDQNYEIPGKIVFENKVKVKGNIDIEETLNSVDLSDFTDDMVFITRDETIDVPVIFSRYVHIENELLVSSNMETNTLFGIDLSNWKNAVFVNKGLIPGKIGFETATIHENLYVDYVNDIDMSKLIPLRTDQVINENLVFGEIKPFHDVVVNDFVNGYKLVDLFETSVFMNSSFQTISSPITFTGNVLVRNNLQISNLVNGKNFSNIVTTNTNQNISAKLVFKDEVILDSNLTVTKDRINDIKLSDWLREGVYLNSEPQEIYKRWIVSGNLTFNENVDGQGLIGGMDIRKIADDVEAKRLYKSVTEKNLVESYTNMCTDVNRLLERAENQIYIFRYFENLEPVKFDSTIQVVYSFNYQHGNYLLVSEAESCMTTLLAWNRTKFVTVKQINTLAVDQFISVYDGDLLFIVTNKIVSNCEISGTNVWMFNSEDLTLLHKMEQHQLLQESVQPGTFYALLNNEVIEYKLYTRGESSLKKYRKWILETSDNVSFVPRGIGIGLAVYNGNILMQLLKEGTDSEDDSYGYEISTSNVGKVVTKANKVLREPYNGNLAVINVGVKGRKRTFLAVASHEETSVKGALDFVKIYEDVSIGKIFHKVPAYKPSSLTSVEFGNSGEALLLFLENQKMLQVYEYKGIVGFQQRTSIHLQGSKLIPIKLKLVDWQNELNVIGVVNDNEITLMQAVMSGNQLLLNRVDCDL